MEHKALFCILWTDCTK